MKLILHHFRKDIRAQRWLLLFSLLIVLLRIGVDWLETLPDYHLANTAEFIRSTSVLPLCGTLLWLVLLVRLIQSEPVIGEASFWLTRPTPRRVYIPSKLLFITLFLVIPYLIPTPLDKLHLGMSTSEVHHELRGDLVLMAYWILLVLWLATYTLSLGQFGLRLVIVVLGLTAILAGSIYGQVFYVADNHGRNGELLFTRLAVFIGLLLFGLTLSLFIQHIGRKGRAGFGVGIGFLVAAALAAFFFPFVISGSVTAPYMWMTSTTSEKFVEVHYSDDWQRRLIWDHVEKTQNWVALSAFTAVAPPPPKPMETGNGPQFQPGGDQVPIIESISNVTFQPEGDQPQRLSVGLREITTYPIEGQYDVESAIMAELPGVHVSLANPGPSSLSLFSLNEAEQKKWLGKTGKLSFSPYGRLYKLQREAEMPLNGPLLARLPGEIIHVARLPRVPQPFVTNDTENKPVLAVWGLGYFGLTPERVDRYYLLVDSQTGTGTFLHPDESYSFGDGMVGLRSKTSRHVYLDLEGDEPLERMTLYIYAFKPGDYFNPTLTAPNFSMTPVR